MYLAQIAEYTQPKRTTLSARYPFIKPYILFGRQFYKKWNNRWKHSIARRKSAMLYPYTHAKHQSVLVRTLGTSDVQLQYNKIQNIRRACQDLDGLVIQPGEVFSLWESIGKPTYKRGYIDGMLLSQGKVITGVGGGLCQLSNFLCWILLHADTKIIERYHHSLDVFPDSGRVLPFGSGATCLYNFVDLQVQNIGQYPLQLHLWATDTHLKGQIRSTEPRTTKYHLLEKHHTFIRHGNTYYRSNELWRKKSQNGHIKNEEKIFSNFAPVLYTVTDEYLVKNHYPCINL